MSERIGWRDSFGVVLVMLILTLLVIAVLGEEHYGQEVAVAIMSVAVLVIYRASHVSGRLWWIAVAVSVTAIAATITGSAFGGPAAALLSGASLLALLGMGPFIIARRLRDSSRVDMETVFASLCIYLIIGMFFSVVYMIVGNLTVESFFTEAPDPTAMDSMYFSFTTLTTLGYGDLTPAGDIGRMLAITEALIGQVYLVTVVAIIVTNLGRETRRNRRNAEQESADEAGE